MLSNLNLMQLFNHTTKKKGEPQWAVVGDTFVVGCQWSDNIVYREESFTDNPDGNNPKYNTKYGMYEPNIGLEKLTLSWGHDEYMYQVLKHNKTTLPQHALNIIRFHSFYPWHSAGDYEHLMKPEDEETKRWVLTFKWVILSDSPLRKLMKICYHSVAAMIYIQSHRKCPILRNSGLIISLWLTSTFPVNWNGDPTTE